MKTDEIQNKIKDEIWDSVYPTCSTLRETYRKSMQIYSDQQLADLQSRHDILVNTSDKLLLENKRLEKVIEKSEELINHMDQWFGNGNVRLNKLRKELSELKGE
jgi:hypothetical protein